MGKYHDVEWIHAFEHELSLPVLIIHMMWNSSAGRDLNRCGLVFLFIPEHSKGHEIATLRYEGSRDTTHADKIRPMLTNFWRVFITGLFFVFFDCQVDKRIDRGCEPLRFQSHLALIIINYQLDFSQEEVSTALVPISRKKNKSVNRFSTNSPRPPFSQLPAPYFFSKHFYKFIFLWHVYFYKNIFICLVKI